MISPPVTFAVDFLAQLSDSGMSYSSVNTARSALSSLLQFHDVNMPFAGIWAFTRCQTFHERVA